MILATGESCGFVYIDSTDESGKVAYIQGTIISASVNYRIERYLKRTSPLQFASRYIFRLGERMHRQTFREVNRLHQCMH